MITEHLDKNNLHHAYLIEGMHNEIIPEIFKFMKEIKVKTIGNPDFCHMSFNSFTVEDARNLKSKSSNLILTIYGLYFSLINESENLIVTTGNNILNFDFFRQRRLPAG